MKESKMILAGAALFFGAVAAQAASPVRGTGMFQFKSTGDVVTVDDVAVSGQRDSFEGYPRLRKGVKFLSKIDRAVETTDYNMELYAGARLVMVVQIEGETPAMTYGRNGFVSDSISYAKSAGEKESAIATMGFTLEECHAIKNQVAPAEQEQAQQDQQDQQEQAQQEKKAAEEGRVKGEPALPAGEGETCKVLVVTKNFEQIPERQQQEQKQEQKQTKN